jgi:hypothetical protein
VVEKCANPSCSSKFRRLSEGRLFVMEAGVSHQSRRLRYFWLCNSCCRTMTVIVSKEDKITIASLRAAQAAA